ncbi:MAG: hypothetical protein GY770_03540, partial [Aestuariibacter sp.]|nr:hypothetical protein [Aestuariibacter sp.]
MLPVLKRNNTLGRISNTLVNFVQEGENINCKVGMITDDLVKSDICLNVVDVDEYTSRTIIMDILVKIQRRRQKIPGKTLGV